MKFSFYILLIFAFGVISCTEYVEGPQGPQGPPGIDGLNGEEAYTFDYEVDFRSPDYSVLIDFPGDFQMLPSDVVQVYLLWSIVDDAEIWRALPQSVIMDQGLFQYNFDFTMDNVSIFLEAEFPVSQVTSDYLLDQVLRIVVIPAQFFESARLDLDLSDYNEVARRFKLVKLPVNRK